MKEQADIPDLLLSQCESYKSVWSYKNTNKRNAFLLSLLGFEPIIPAAEWPKENQQTYQN